MNASATPGPDDALYLLTDNSAGRILRVVPAR
jgi:glucose/arabinose dehydrogenase